MTEKKVPCYFIQRFFIPVPGAEEAYTDRNQSGYLSGRKGADRRTFRQW